MKWLAYATENQRTHGGARASAENFLTTNHHHTHLRHSRRRTSSHHTLFNTLTDNTTMSGRGKGGKVCISSSSSPFSTFVLTVVQGLGKGGAKRHRKILRDNIQGVYYLSSSPLSLFADFAIVVRYHQARHPPSRSPRRREAYLWPHLRGDPRRPEDLPREHRPRLCHLH